MNKITIITGYYYPEDTAIGLYTTQMVEYLEKKEYEINIITGFPSYPQWKIRDSYKDKKTFLIEKYNSANIYRYKEYIPSKPTFFKRILLLIDFTLGSLWNVFKIKECDLVISIVPHTSTVLLGWILKKRTKAKLLNHIQDFEFDAARETGIYSKESKIKKVFFNFLFKIEQKLLDQGNLNSTISYSMLKKLKIKSKSKSFYFPNWIDANKINPSSSTQHPYLKSPRFKVLYSGNIGDKQDWDFFLLFAGRLRSYNVDIIIVGDGAKRTWLCEKIANLEKVTYHSPVDYNELSSLLCTADLHVLFQKNNVVDSVMPSKLLGMMASSKPSLITGNINSEVKVVVEESRGGFYVADENIDKCISIVENLIKHPDKISELGISARQYVINKFSSEKVLEKFERKISELIS